jgi:hypothetical protein
MNFMETFQIKLKPFHLTRIQAIDKTDFEPVAKKVNRDLGGVTKDYLDEGIENLKRYYVVALLDPVNQHAVSRPVDPFWHAHVLFTREYKNFCHEVFDGEFIHHVPLDPDDLEQVKYVTKLYTHTLKVYKEIFRSVNANWWPQANISGFQPVCRHQDVKGEAIVKNGLFPVEASQKA